MKALSIRQPYAWLIVNRIKDVENRTWRTGYRGQVLIHAGKPYPKAEHADDYERWHALGFPKVREDMLGGIVGIATITGCVARSDSTWWIGPVGFTLADARPLPELIPCKGKLGFFDVPADVLALLPHGFTAGVKGMPSDCERINCRREWAGGDKCPADSCEFARGVPPVEGLSRGVSGG